MSRPRPQQLIETLEKRLLMARVAGIDVSHWQGTINWANVAAAGKEFVFHKATEGIDYVDPTAATNNAGAAAAGMLVGVYHFAHPDTNSAAAEANWFIQNASQYASTGDLRPVLDLEDGATLTPAALSAWANEYCLTVKNALGVDPLIYLNTNYATNEVDASVTSHDLWIANWSTAYGDPMTTGSPPVGVWGAGNWDFWQYSSTGTVSGISGAVDLDVYQGDRATLVANFVVGNTPPPQNPGTINGSVFQDTNGNAALEAGEPMIAGRTVYLDADNDAVRDASETLTATNASGQYSFTVNPGTYTVRQVVPAGWYQTVPASNGARTATVTSGGTTNLFAFGSAAYGSISGSVFRDTNSNGLRDAGETGLSAWTVYLDANNNGILDTGETSAVTNAVGDWAFNNLKTGNYVVRVVLKKKFVRTAPTGGMFTHTLFSGTTIAGDLFGVR
ncbi:MAG: lysozyme [Phycisphaerales bacterium]|jgi:GH25 family lysozyme M1 (1,4-beta-N-acetylmuramidase)|nr:lysozyme [Phycisphaerales bacterium]